MLPGSTSKAISVDGKTTAKVAANATKGLAVATGWSVLLLHRQKTAGWNVLLLHRLKTVDGVLLCVQHIKSQWKSLPGVLWAV